MVISQNLDPRIDLSAGKVACSIESPLRFKTPMTW
jgi:hypothetical protein